MNAQELRQKKAQKLDGAQSLMKAVETRDGMLTDEERKQFDALMAEVETLEADAVRAEKLEGFTGVAKPQPEAPAHHQRRTPDTTDGIYCRFLRTGDTGAQRELNQAVVNEYRASNNTDMNITTAADGGDLVPVGHYNQIIERARPAALYNRLGLRMIPGSGTTVNVPVDAEADTGEFVSTNESGEFDRDAPAVSKVAMTLVKYTKRVDITYELLQDEDSRLLDFLSGYVADGFAYTLNKLMITEALADGTAGLTLDSATAIGAAEIPELLYKLPSVYRRGANVAWLMQGATEGYLAGLNGTNFFTFAPTPGASFGLNGEGRLWGVPSFSDDNMGAKQASGKSLLVANWNYMGMRLDPTMTLLRDPYSRAKYGEIQLNYYFRADFEVLQAAAFQYATHPTA